MRTEQTFQWVVYVNNFIDLNLTKNMSYYRINVKHLK